MSSKNYSAGLVSQRFWFYELKQYIELLNEGKKEKDIKQLNDEENLFGAVSESRAKETFNGTKRRVNALGEEMQNLFPKLNIDNQKIAALIAIMILNDLFLEFMMEVFQGHLSKGNLQLTTTEIKSFFSEKQRTNEVVASWKSYTYNRLGSAYKNYLSEAGLIRENGLVDIITPKVLDSRVIQWLKSIDRIDIIKALTGGSYL